MFLGLSTVTFNVRQFGIVQGGFISTGKSTMIYRKGAPLEKLTRQKVIELSKGTGDISGVDLSGMNLSGLDLIAVNFRGTNLKGANLSGANFSMSDFGGADLSGCNMSGSNFIGANFSHAPTDHRFHRNLTSGLPGPRRG